MAIQPTDLFVVQQGGSVYKVTKNQVSESIRGDIDAADLPIATAATLGGIRVGDNLSIDPSTGIMQADLPDAIDYKGEINPTDPAPSATVGQAWIVSADGIFHSSFDNISGKQGAVGDLVVYEGNIGHEWDLIQGLFRLAVISVKGTEPIYIDDSDANNPVVKIREATANGTDGSMSSADKAKLDSIQPGSDVGTVTEVTVNEPLSVINGTATPDISIADATTLKVGVVRLADTTAINLGTSERVVDASQLKVVSDGLVTLNDKVDNLSLYNFFGDDPIVVDVDANDNVTYSIKDAAPGQKGAVEVATEAEVKQGTNIAKTLSPATARAVYLIKDFDELDALP